jgi:16S rRNA (cytidine1402-2'-O)-methyltransferase
VASTVGTVGTLYLVSTPIGNLADITYRAVRVLREVDLILAEDTRHTRVLLDHYEIRAATAALHEHNEARAVPRIVERLRRGESLALVSDAGTPVISDPGARLVQAAVAAGAPVVAVPGASALLSALVVSAIPSERFTFYGFLPRTGKTRRAAIDEIARLSHACVLYESPQRVAATLADLTGREMGRRRAVVARELTKKFEEVRRGTVAELAAYYGETEHSAPRGELVIVIEGASVLPTDENTIRDQVQALRAQGSTPREILAQLVDGARVPRNLAYRLVHELAAKPER